MHFHQKKHKTTEHVIYSVLICKNQMFFYIGQAIMEDSAARGHFVVLDSGRYVIDLCVQTSECPSAPEAAHRSDRAKRSGDGQMELISPTDITNSTSAGPLLVPRLRRWPSSGPALVERLWFVGLCPP